MENITYLATLRDVTLKPSQGPRGGVSLWSTDPTAGAGPRVV